MPLRTLIHRGVEWTVWNVVPSLEGSGRIPLSRASASGWLCFQSPDEKRRIAPAPEGWESWSDRELILRLEQAKVVAPAPPIPRRQATPAARADGEIERPMRLGWADPYPSGQSGDWQDRDEEEAEG